MVLVNLNPQEVTSLQSLMTETNDVRQWRRAQALLWLDDGESVEEVALRLSVTRQTVYNWAARFDERARLDVTARAADAARCGRPCTAAGIIDPLITKVIDRDPRELGYRSTIWTAGLLRQHLAQAHRLRVSTKSVSRALSRREIVWKRPRHTPARRAPFWRQAKGG